MFSSLEPRNSELKGWYKEEDSNMPMCDKCDRHITCTYMFVVMFN